MSKNSHKEREILFLFSQIVGEDEPFDFDLFLRTETANLTSPKAAEFLSKGVSAFLPIDLHSRLE